MFPVNSDLGDASIRINGDEIDNIIAKAKSLALSNNMRQPVGMQMMNPKQAPQQQPMRFGGVFDSGDNPGREMNERAAQDVRDIYESYKRPLNPQVSGPSNDEIYAENYFKRKNEEKKADAALANSGTKGWKTVTITDPNDPSKQINARINEITGETQPINLDGGIITRTGSAKDIQTQIDNEAKGASNRKAGIDKANESLSVLSDLMDDKGNLTPEGARAVGLSSIGNFIPTTKGYSGSLKIAKLRNEQVLNLIKELKEQSRTGATGMGNMSNKDLGVIEKAASLLNTGLDEDEFKKQLGIVKTELQDIITRLQSTPDRNIRPAASHSPTNAPKAPDGWEYVRNATDTGWTAKKIGSK